MIKFEIQSAEITTKAGTSSKTGKPYQIREQEGWGYFYGKDGKPHPHPMRVRLTLEDGQAPYAPGNYLLDPASLFVDRFSQVAIRAMLRPATPVTAAAQKAA